MREFAHSAPGEGGYQLSNSPTKTWNDSLGGLEQKCLQFDERLLDRIEIRDKLESWLCSSAHPPRMAQPSRCGEPQLRRSSSSNIAVARGRSIARHCDSGLRNLTILIEVEVSSMNTSRAVSSMPCARIQRQRVRTTSGRSCSAARRLFLKLIPWRSNNRQTALRPPGIRRTHRRKDFIQCQIRLLGNHSQQKGGMPFQGRLASAARLRRSASSICQRCSYLTAELALTSKRSAASRRVAPVKTPSRTRSRRSRTWLRHRSLHRINAARLAQAR